jgi:crotonobetainyl-CoA:carnitine CoA-transferase CaiB-like acyl-CoA transferase
MGLIGHPERAAGLTKAEAGRVLTGTGIAAGPCLADEEVADPHVAARDMLVEIPRPDGVEQPVLVPGNPVRTRAPRCGRTASSPDPG